MPTNTFFNLPDEKRNSLIDIALDEFAENDYDGVSITRYVTRAGIAKGSFYQYFTGKDDLLAHLLHLAGEQKAAYFAATAAGDRAQGEGGIFIRLRHMVEMGVRFEVEHPRMARLAYRIASGGGYPPALIAEAQAGAHAFFRDLVAQGKADGTVRADVDDDLAAWLFGTVFSDFGRYAAGRLNAEEQEAAAAGGFFSASAMRPLFDQLIAVLEHGLSSHESAPPVTG